MILVFINKMERMEEYSVGFVMFTAKNKDKPLLFLCLTQDPALAALLGKTAEDYDDEQGFSSPL